MLRSKLTSSLEKIFPDGNINSHPSIKKLSALRGERVNLQLAYTYEVCEGDPELFDARFKPQFSGSLAPYVTLKKVECIPAYKTVSQLGCDDNMLRTAPGLFPDLITDYNYGGAITLCPDVLLAGWIEIELPESIAPGEHTLTVTLDCERFGKDIHTFTLDVIDALLPDEQIYFTQWFHADCLAQYYHVPVWSERHWEIVENFARVAAKNGINTILTPIFTPPLDTAEGGERLTVQLIDITVTKGEYSFGFEKLDRWVAMCDRVGIRYFEIAHLFTQWGVKYAPKVMATVDGEYKRIFGWETSAHSPEYVAFLRKLLSEMLLHLGKRGDDKRCFFHISDEPSLDHLESYTKAKASVADVLDGYVVMDAISDFDFYKTGAIEHPITANDHIEPFLNAGVEGLWTYYCCGQWDGVSNRFFSMPACRNRSIGMQIYKYKVAGFLQWGYNFYNNRNSDSPINPYLVTAADYSFPAGDSFSVYPADNGEALESTRIKVFYDALQDIRAMKLCEKYYSHAEVVAAIEEVFGAEVRFKTCARSAKTVLDIREKINEMIKSKIK